MRITNFNEAAAFLNTTGDFLRMNEPANSLMLGICLRLRAHPDRIEQPPYLASIESEGSVVLTAIMTPPHKLVVNGLLESGESEINMLVDNLLENSIEVPGVLGPVKLATAFSEIWARKAGSAARKGMSQRVFELREVYMPPLSPGYLRPAREEEVELAVDWRLAFQRETFTDVNATPQAEQTKILISEKALFFWDDVHPVSMALKTRPTENGISIGDVYTPPKFRRRGYASSCVASLSCELLSAGYRYCSLFTDLANPTSNSIYQKMGYQPVCDYVDYFFDKRQ